ncbi:hypothetical protein [Bradyrhizobium sp. 150]|uniref:phage fiber-tail adaptor protein n=1 Tax=Bradyrhizobium sp. 150 TaxID=2782625 RepID=UPI001FF9A449|nr:hypothetical protein [Bradyrhizobium sp. 150]MCK1670304.1 hypothetical protein [Bradyrhizobium sp. 150]
MSKTWDRSKDPNEVVDYDLSWADQMTADTDTIASSTWTVPVSITKDSSSNTTTRTKVWLSGGTTGETYTLLNRVVTTGGRTFDQSVKLKMKDH